MDNSYLLHVPGNEDEAVDVYVAGREAAFDIALAMVQPYDYCEVFTPCGDERGNPSEKYPGRNILAFVSPPRVRLL